MRVLNTFSYKYQIAFIAIKLLLFHVAGSRDTAAQGKYFFVYPEGKETLSLLHVRFKCVFPMLD